MKRLPLLVIVWVLSCNDRTQEDPDCYERNPDPGAKLGPHDLVCGEPFGYLPETPEGVEGEGPYHVGYCEPAESVSECSLCPTGDVNDRITAHLLEVMAEKDGCDPPEVTHIIPACVTTPEQGSNTGCCFNAYYWGSCNIKDS